MVQCRQLLQMQQSVSFFLTHDTSWSYSPKFLYCCPGGGKVSSIPVYQSGVGYSESKYRFVDLSHCGGYDSPFSRNCWLFRLLL